MTYAEIQVLDERIAMIHALFNSLTGSTQPLEMRHRYQWEVWFAEREKRKQDPEKTMRLVIDHTKRFNLKRSRDFQRQLTWRNVLNKFDDWLDEAESDQRRTEAAKRQPCIDPARKSVLEAIGRSAEPAQAESVHVSKVDWIAELRKAVNG